ncbi:MAG: Maf family protein [Thomasclavelia sp.]|nr:Maf family protein [Thomasclavelia sp.]
MKNKRIILASSSPRRKELLKNHNIDFIVDFDNTDELLDNSLPIKKQLEKVAFNKGKNIALKYQNDIVISADTMVLCNNELLGKAKDRNEAFKQLKMLSNNVQTVYTAVAIFKDKQQIVFVDESTVIFKKLTDEDINKYLDTGEYIGKAGSYAIQGIGQKLVKSITGDLENIIGLPVYRILPYLE